MSSSIAYPMIYLDYHATTPVLPEVWEAMHPFAVEIYGNPSSSHAAGRRARQALEDAREQIAALLDAFPDEVIFTSGATEANNLALFGLAGEAPATIVSSPIEHPCIIEPLKQLAQRGFEIDWLAVQPNGLVDLDRLRGRTSNVPRLIAMMLVNHEMGAIQPVRDAASLSPAVSFHCDAAQAVGKLPVRFHELNVSSLSLSGHKFSAPKGIGALLLRRGMKLQPGFYGGHQQQGRRPGTEPVALAVGMAKALEITSSRRDEVLSRVRQIKSEFLNRLNSAVVPTVVNGAPDGSPYVVNVAFPGCRADLLLMTLDLAGVACSTGSACSSGSLLPSPVLRAMGVSNAVLESSMRFSFSSTLTDEDVLKATDHIIRSVQHLRQPNR